MKYFFTFIFSMILTVSFLGRQHIYDQIVVYNFSPSDEIIELIKDVGLNDYGRFLYLASQPVIESAQDLNEDCFSTEITNSILGCYSKGKIYIYDVRDPQLKGVKEVTAVHEIMHAAYDRLNFIDKEKVNKLLEIEYKKLEGQEDFIKRIALYDKIDPNQRYNELHSIIGTEIETISSNLEKYYKRYFINRQKVVLLNKNYLNVFKEYDNRRFDLENQLSSLGPIIISKKLSYELDVELINVDINDFNIKANNYSFETLVQFNNERSLLVERINKLEAIRLEISRDIELYDLIYSEYDSNVSQLNKLYKSIDSSLAPAPSI